MRLLLESIQAGAGFALGFGAVVLAAKAARSAFYRYRPLRFHPSYCHCHRCLERTRPCGRPRRSVRHELEQRQEATAAAELKVTEAAIRAEEARKGRSS